MVLTKQRRKNKISSRKDRFSKLDSNSKMPSIPPIGLLLNESTIPERAQQGRFPLHSVPRHDTSESFVAQRHRSTRVTIVRVPRCAGKQASKPRRHLSIARVSAGGEASSAPSWKNAPRSFTRGRKKKKWRRAADLIINV